MTRFRLKSRTIELVPAYGRKYNSQSEALADWEAGKDFKIYGGPYTSIRDESQLLEEYNFIDIYWDFLNGYKFTVT
jgi:hypothetical protein